MTLNFDKHAQEGNRFIADLAKDLGYPDDRERSARVLRAVLNALRDLLPPAENMQFIAQLPMCLKAVYVEGYTHKVHREKARQNEAFLSLVKKNYGHSVSQYYTTDDDLEKAGRTVLYSLRQYISVGEMEDIIAPLPKEIKQFISRSASGFGSYDYFL